MTADESKQIVGRHAAELVEDGMIVGLGTGSTADHFVDRLAERVRQGLRVTGVPTSERTAECARQRGIPLREIEDAPVIDIACDGADEVDPEGRLIKGLGGALTREKIVARRSRTFVVMVDVSKLVSQLGERCPVPVEVRPPRVAGVVAALAALGARPKVRGGDASPSFTDNGNHIVDAWFDRIADPKALELRIDGLEGVVANGLFVGLTDLVLIGAESGVREAAFMRTVFSDR